MLHLEGKFVVVVYGYDVLPWTCYAQLSSEWRMIHSSVILHTISGARTLTEMKYEKKKLILGCCANETRMSNLYLCVLTAVHRCFGNITNSSCFHNITDDEFLNCLVLWYAASTVCATYWFYMTTVMFASSSITSLLRL